MKLSNQGCDQSRSPASLWPHIQGEACVWGKAGSEPCERTPAGVWWGQPALGNGHEGRLPELTSHQLAGVFQRRRTRRPRPWLGGLSVASACLPASPTCAALNSAPPRAPVHPSCQAQTVPGERIYQVPCVIQQVVPVSPYPRPSPRLPL